jgi:hypothetical protein
MFFAYSFVNCQGMSVEWRWIAACSFLFISRLFYIMILCYNKDAGTVNTIGMDWLLFRSSRDDVWLCIHWVVEDNPKDDTSFSNPWWWCLLYLRFLLFPFDGFVCGWLRSGSQQSISQTWRSLRIIAGRNHQKIVALRLGSLGTSQRS